MEILYIDAVKHMKKQLTQNELKKYRQYDKETGLFTGNTHLSNGYPALSINGVRYYAHRLAWLYVFGLFPKNDIDHINGNKTDNRICNLRAVSRRDNLRNMKSKGVSGISGITFDSSNLNYMVRVRDNNGKVQWYGRFDSLCEAAIVRMEAEQELNPDNWKPTTPLYCAIKETCPEIL